MIGRLLLIAVAIISTTLAATTSTRTVPAVTVQTQVSRTTYGFTSGPIVCTKADHITNTQNIANGLDLICGEVSANNSYRSIGYNVITFRCDDNMGACAMFYFMAITASTDSNTIDPAAQALCSAAFTATTKACSGDWPQAATTFSTNGVTGAHVDMQVMWNDPGGLYNACTANLAKAATPSCCDVWTV